MINTIIFTFASVTTISLISLFGILALSLKTESLKKILIYLVSFSVGTMLASAFFHLLPESVEKFDGFHLPLSLYIISGILFAFLLETIIHWHHCHNPQHLDQQVHTFAYMNLIGDSIHNLIDGMIIAGAYLVDIHVGLTATIAVILHEIPQEIGDFGVLLQGGLSKRKAIFYNFITALTAIIGATFVLLVSTQSEILVKFLLPFAAGNFIYIAGSDLIPELHKETSLKKNIIQFFFLLLGILLIALLGLLEV